MEQGEHQRPADQAKPEQVQLLLAYGRRLAAEGPLDGSLVAGGPPCACGNSLRATKLNQRVNKLPGRPVILCDLCNLTIRSGNTWACQNGCKTVVHPATYDVCDMCMAKYVGGNLDDEEDSGDEGAEGGGEGLPGPGARGSLALGWGLAGALLALGAAAFLARRR